MDIHCESISAVIQQKKTEERRNSNLRLFGQHLMLGQRTVIGLTFVLIFGAVCNTASASGESAAMMRISERKAVQLGYRDSSIPFSYLAGSKEPVGMSIDLCKKIVDAIAQELKLKSLDLIWVPVTSSNRVPLMKEGKIDLECGATTNTADRRRDVAFTIPHYVAGVRILSRASVPLMTPSELEGKSVSTTKGGAAAEMLEALNKQLRKPVKLQLFSQTAEGFAAVREGRADAWVTDDIQLVAQRAAAPNPKDFVISKTHLSVEPLAIMLPKDDATLKMIVDRAMRTLMRSGDVNRLYSKWFEEPIPPKGINLQLPVHTLTREIYRSPTDFVPDLRILRMQ
jgi:ABC-type amino acid transport substrate-binding protein